jgi:hypothetical protein
MIDLSVSFYGAAGESLGATVVQTYGIRYADAKGVSPVPKWLARTVAHRAEIPPDGSTVEWCDVPAKARKAEARLVYYFIDPAYVPSLRQRQVDLSAHQPVVMARATSRVP